jgi:hypothetical protein
MKSSILCTAAAAALMFGVASSKASELLYSFETGDSPNALDGFKNLGGNTLSQGTTGATVGTGALEVNNTNSSFAGISTTSIPSALLNPAVTAISLDVTIPAGETSTAGYYLLGVALFDNNAPADVGEFQVDGSDEQHLDFYHIPGTGTPFTITIPLTGADPNSGVDGSYAQLLANGFVPDGFEIFEDHNGPLQFSIDNIQAVGVSVPEPTSLSLAAVAGGMLLKRRSRKS